MYVLGPCGPLQQTLPRMAVSPATTTPEVFTARDFEALLPCAGNLFCYPVVPPSLYKCECGTTQSAAATSPAWSISHCPAACPLCSSCPSPPLLPVLVTVSSLTPWLSDLHTVRLSGSSGWFLFLHWLLSLFWLCKEVKWIYLCLCRGQKPSASGHS